MPKQFPHTADPFNATSLSINTVPRRAEELHSMFGNTVLKNEKISFVFSITCDESIDVADTAQLLTCDRHREKPQ